MYGSYTGYIAVIHFAFWMKWHLCRGDNWWGSELIGTRNIGFTLHTNIFHMLRDDQLFWDFSKSTILVDDLDLVSRSQHSGRVKQPVVVSQPGFVRSRSNQLCECYIQADQYVEPLGTEKARERGRGGLDVMFACHLDCCIKTLSQYTTFVTGILAYAVNMRILAWKLCMFFRHHELSFSPIIISNKKGASFEWLGRYPTSVSGMIQ